MEKFVAASKEMVWIAGEEKKWKIVLGRFVMQKAIRRQLNLIMIWPNELTILNDYTQTIIRQFK